DRSTLEMQNAALRHLGRRLTVTVPTVVSTPAGENIVFDGGYHLRVLTWVPGTPLAAVDGLDHTTFLQLGRLAAEGGAAFAGVEHPSVDGEFEWDTRRAAAVVSRLARSVEPDEADRLAHALCPLNAAARGQLDHLPRQVIHADVNDHNVLADESEP